MTARAWLRHVLLFFSFGFAIHAAGLLLHEFVGHGGVMVVAGCGVSKWELTYFGHGSVDGPHPCTAWTTGRLLTMEWGGIAVCIAVGAAAIGLAPRVRNPLARALVLTAGWFFLVGQLEYAVTGAFHRRFDPERTTLLLDRRGFGWLAWVIPIVPFAAVVALVPQAAFAALRRHFNASGRGAALAQLAATLGVAGALYAAALHVEFELSAGYVKAELDQAALMRARRAEDAVAREVRRTGKPLTPEQIAELEAAERPFPMIWLLHGGAALGLIAAAARRIHNPGNGRPQDSDRTLVNVVHLSAATLALLIFVLIRAGGDPLR